MYFYLDRGEGRRREEEGYDLPVCVCVCVCVCLCVCVCVLLTSILLTMATRPHIQQQQIVLKMEKAI